MLHLRNNRMHKYLLGNTFDVFIEIIQKNNTDGIIMLCFSFFEAIFLE